MMSDAKPPVLAIAAPVRGEAPYLLEWIAYHRALGIRAFVLGDNAEGDDPTSALLQALHQRHIAFRFDWRGRTHFQIEFNRQALDAARLFADGMFLIDVDEFLRPADGLSVLEIGQKWLSDPSIGAVALNWAIFGSSERVEAGDGLVIERFTRRAPQDFNINRHAKASAAEVVLKYDGNQMGLGVHDYGIGISKGKLEESNADGAHLGFGLTGMKHRVQEQHGQFKFISTGAGTTIQVELAA